jgi:hypothetical protein
MADGKMPSCLRITYRLHLLFLTGPFPFSGHIHERMLKCCHEQARWLQTTFRSESLGLADWLPVPITTIAYEFVTLFRRK